jgi:hypothetical protein
VINGNDSINSFLDRATTAQHATKGCHFSNEGKIGGIDEPLISFYEQAIMEVIISFSFGMEWRRTHVVHRMLPVSNRGGSRAATILSEDTWQRWAVEPLASLLKGILRHYHLTATLILDSSSALVVREVLDEAAMMNLHHTPLNSTSNILTSDDNNYNLYITLYSRWHTKMLIHSCKYIRFLRHCTNFLSFKKRKSCVSFAVRAHAFLSTI